MEGDLKYFSPNLQDLHIGYQCEVLSNMHSESGELADTIWMPITLQKNNMTFSVAGKEVKVNNILNLGNTFRTPYLTKEDVESLGWIRYKDKYVDRMFKKDNLYMDFAKSGITIHRGEGTILFDGTCPSINELKIITKLLGI